MGLFSSKEKKVIVVAELQTAKCICNNLLHRDEGYAVLGVFTVAKDDVAVVPDDDMNVLGGLDDVIQYLKGNGCVDEVYCATEVYSKEDVLRLFDLCSDSGVLFCTVPSHIGDFRRRMKIRRMGYSQVLIPCKEPLQMLCNRLLKRTLDLLVSLLVLLTVFPIAVVVMAFITKRKGAGSVLRLARREGAFNRSFNEYSFTMAKEGTSVSILPRYINVFFGHLSLVGPESVVRDWVKPGLTGWSQIHGHKSGTLECENSDIWYIGNWSLWLDVRIIIRSFINNK